MREKHTAIPNRKKQKAAERASGTSINFDLTTWGVKLSPVNSTEGRHQTATCVHRDERTHTEMEKERESREEGDCRSDGSQGTRHGSAGSNHSREDRKNTRQGQSQLPKEIYRGISVSVFAQFLAVTPSRVQSGSGDRKHGTPRTSRTCCPQQEPSPITLISLGAEKPPLSSIERERCSMDTDPSALVSYSITVRRPLDPTSGRQAVQNQRVGS